MIVPIIGQNPPRGYRQQEAQVVQLLSVSRPASEPPSFSHREKERSVSMASIYQRNGKFYGSFKEGSRWVRRLLGKTRAEAERRLDEILQGDYTPPTPPRF